jgi:hypothetical protein
MPERKPIPITDEMLSDMYEKRMLLFLETDNNKFVQIMFNKEQFALLSIFLTKLFPSQKTPGKQKMIDVDFPVGKEIDGKTFDGMNSRY